MNGKNVLLSALLLVAFSGFAFAVNASISPVTLAITNTTVNGNGSVNYYNTSLMFTAVTNSIYSLNLTFPFDTRFANTRLPAFGGGGASSYYNITSNVSGSVANWTVNGTLIIDNSTAGSRIDVVFNTTGNATLTIGNTYYFSIFLISVANPRSANGSTVYNGFNLSIEGYTSNGTQVANNPAGTLYTLAPQNATNFTVYGGNGQTSTVNSSTYSTLSNFSVLVTDQFGNPYSGQSMNFSAVNTSSSTANMTVSLNGSTDTMGGTPGWLGHVLVSTNSTGHAGGVVALIGESTGNTSGTYQIRVTNTSAGQATTSFESGGEFELINITAQATTISYYLLTPSNAAPAFNEAFNILVSSYDQFSNINGTSSFSGSLSASAANIGSLSYSTDGTTYLAYSSTLTRALASGNVTTYFKHSKNDGVTFTFGDANLASGQTTVTVTGDSHAGQSGGGSAGGWTGGVATSTPVPSASPTVAPTADAGDDSGDQGTEPTVVPTTVPTYEPTVQPAGGETTETAAGGIDPMVTGGVVLVVLLGGAYYFFMRGGKKGL